MFTIAHSCLVVIDVQGNLALRMHNAEDLIQRIAISVKVAKILHLPIIYTEQVPEKLGRTNPDLMADLHGISPIEKSTFSCCENLQFIQKLRDANRTEIFIAGIESHVCVFQTVSDLLEKGFQVQVLSDAVSSRTIENKKIALARMRDLGAVITSTEMMGTELIQGAGHPKFKEILTLIK